MSLVFDALRQQGTQPTQSPTELGSVLAPGRRWRRWRFIIGLLCLVAVSAVMWGEFSLMERQVLSVAPVTTSPAPSVPDEPSAPTETPVPEAVEENVVSPQQSVLPSQSRLPGDALARLAETAQMPLRAESAPELAKAENVEGDNVVLENTALDNAQPASAPVSVPVASSVPEKLTAEAEASTSKAANPAELFMAFNGAMAASQWQEAEAVIERARQALGESHLIVARMQGYYCMQADCPEQARQAYSTILARLPRDREAGYNLAVLDWQAGRQAEALRRVRSMLSQHPEDDALRALQRQMGAR